MIGIRVDGNRYIGMGHISRCLSIASALRRMNEKITFICSSDSLVEEIISHHFQVIKVPHSKYDNWEICEEQECIQSNDISILFIDSFYVTETNLEIIHKLTKVVYLDDLQLYDYDVDAIINYNIDAVDAMYSSSSYPFRRLCLGIRYFPLKESLYFKEKKKLNKVVKTVLITTGSTDPCHCMHKILSDLNIRSYCDIKFYAIIGLFYESNYRNFLSEKHRDKKNLVFLNWGQNMKKIYSDSDIVISPGSTTIYESLSIGVPCISFQFVDNHHEECIALDKFGLVPFAGDYSEESDNICIGKLFEAELDYTTRKIQYDKFVSLFDGNGANRIAEIIRSLL